jgi:hypothetical protein
VGRIALLVTTGVILLACAAAALAGVGTAGPGAILGLLLSMVIAASGVVLRRRPNS